MISLYSAAGLCNRLRAIDSTLILAEELGQPATVYWPINEGCGAALSALFQPIENVSAIEQAEQRAEALWKRRRNSLSFRIATFMGSGISIDDTVNQSRRKASVIVTHAAKCREIMIRTDHAFMYPERFTSFQPLDGLDARIEECCARFLPTTIGLHIRRGDHVRAMKNSPLASFVANIHQQLATQPDATFFLCTDCDTTRQSLVDQFGTKTILSNQHELTRGSQTGVENAIVELWSLSRCGEIWGSLGSSFSETAFHLSGKRLKLRFIAGDALIDN